MASTEIINGRIVTVAQLRLIAPRCPVETADLHSRCASSVMAAIECTTVLRAAAMLGQWCLESGEFRFLEELGDGSAYENRKDLGNLQPGFGRKYKGRGPCMLTGYLNYGACGDAIGVDLRTHPELVAEPE